MIITIRNSNTGAFNAYSFRSWCSYELLDGSGASITGGYPITYAYQQSIIDASRQTSGAMDYLNVARNGPANPIVIEFGSARADLLHGTLTGYITFTGQERLILVTDSALLAGNYEVRCEFLAAARVNINGGRISVLPS